MLAEMAEAAGRAKLGEEAWAKMSEVERAAKVKTHLGDCNGLKRPQIMFVIFCANRCEHCRQSYPLFAELAQPESAALVCCPFAAPVATDLGPPRDPG